MKTNDELRQQMWELAYGLLPSDEVASLHTRIKSDPVAARLYAEVRLQTDLVADAAKVSDPSVQFHAEGEPTIIRPIPAKRGASSGAAAKASSAKGVNWLVGTAGMALAALLCLVLFRPATTGDQLADRFVVTTVEAPPQMQAGVSQQVSIFTCDIDQVGKPAEVDLRVVDAAGQEQLRHSLWTDELGRCTVEVPGQAIQEGVRLEVSASTEPRVEDALKSVASVSPVTIDAAVAPEPIETYVMLDKPAYAPGETINFAVRQVKRFSKEPVTTETELQDGAEAKTMDRPNDSLWAAQATAGDGLVTGTYQLDSNVDPSLMGLALEGHFSKRLGEGGSPNEWYFHDELEASLPKLSKQQADAAKLALGSRFGGAANMRRELHRRRAMAADETPPPAASPATAALEPKSKADSTAGISIADDFTRLKEVGSSPFDSQAERREVVAAGKPIEVALPTDRASRFLVTARCADRYVATEHFSFPQENETRKSSAADTGDVVRDTKADHESVVSLTPAPEIDGEIVVNVYDDSQQPPQLVAAHRYYREPQERLLVELAGLKQQYAPGERVRLQVQVVDERSRPVDATLSVRVWNERLVQAADSQVRDLASSVFSNGSEKELDGSEVAGAKFGYAGGVGGGGSLNFGANAGQSASGFDALAMRGALGTLDEVQQRESLFGNIEVKRLEASNLMAVKAAYESAVSDARHAAMSRKATIGRLLLVGGFAVLVLLGMQALLRASAKASIWLPSAAIALASLAIGAVWLNPHFEIGEVLQTAAVPEAKPATEPAEPERAKDASIEDSASVAENETSVSRFEQSDSRSDPRPVEMQLSDKFADTKDNIPPPPRDAEQDPADATAAELNDFRMSRSSVERTAPPTPAPAVPQTAPADAPAPAPASDAPVPAPAESTTELENAKPTNSPPPPGKAEFAESASPKPVDAAPELRDKSALSGVAETANKVVRQQVAGPKPSAETHEKELAAAGSGASSRLANAGRDARGRNGGDLPAPAPLAAGLVQPSGGAKRPAEASDRVTNRSNADADEADAGSNAIGRDIERRIAGGVGGKKTSENDFTHSRGMRTLADHEQRSQSGSIAAPASLLFEPSLKTDSSGRATVEFTLPDVDCEYRVLIDAIGHGRIGSVQQVIAGQAETGDEE